MKAFIVGGSSSIGAAIIRALLDAGAEVAATYRTAVPPGLGDAAWSRADIRSPEDIEALAGPAAGADVAVLLPGLSLGQQLGEYADDQIDEVVEVNFSGQFRAVQRLAPVMADPSHIIIMGSMAGQRGSADPLYGATKGAMHALAKSLAKSLAPKTRVNVVAPGMVTDTAMVDGTPQIRPRRAPRRNADGAIHQRGRTGQGRARPHTAPLASAERRLHRHQRGPVRALASYPLHCARCQTPRELWA